MTEGKKQNYESMLFSPDDYSHEYRRILTESGLEDIGSIRSLKKWLRRTSHEIRLDNRRLNDYVLSAYANAVAELDEWHGSGSLIRVVIWASIAKHVRWCDETGLRTFVMEPVRDDVPYLIDDFCKYWDDEYEILKASGYEKQFIGKTHGGCGDVIADRYADMLIELSRLENCSNDEKAAAFQMFCRLHDSSRYSEFFDLIHMTACSETFVMISRCICPPYDDETVDILSHLFSSNRSWKFYYLFDDWCKHLGKSRREDMIGLLRFCRDMDYDWNTIDDEIMFDSRKCLDIDCEECRLQENRMVDCMSRIGNIGDASLIDRLRLMSEYEKLEPPHSELSRKTPDLISDDTIKTPPNVFWEDLLNGDLD